MRWTRYIALLSTITVLHCTPVDVLPANAPFLYRSLSFDIAYVDSSSIPRDTSLNDLRESIARYRLCPAQSVKFNVRPATIMNKVDVWNSQLLTTFEVLNRGKSSPSPRLPDLNVFVSFVHGPFLMPPDYSFVICGCTYGEASFTALVDKYQRSSQESALLLHEFGHVIDLPGDDHCPDGSCVMYELVRTNGAGFCDSCLLRINTLRRY